MCGIAGLVSLSGSPVPEGVAERMTATLEHRGPDDLGHWRQGPVAFGHRRLTIIDLIVALHCGALHRVVVGEREYQAMLLHHTYLLLTRQRRAREWISAGHALSDGEGALVRLPRLIRAAPAEPRVTRQGAA